MNKQECKKYLKRAYYSLIKQSKSMTPENIAIAMKNEIDYESEIYIAYAKLAMHNLNNSATVITANQLAAQIDIIPRIYKQQDVVEKSKNK